MEDCALEELNKSDFLFLFLRPLICIFKLSAPITSPCNGTKRDDFDLRKKRGAERSSKL